VSFHVGKEKRKSGDMSYRIRYWDNNVHRTLPRDQHPEFASYEEAVNFCNSQNAKADADRHLEKHAKGMAHLDFKNKYGNFEKEIEGFLEWYSEEAPNSWEACRSWLQNYVVPYFIGKGLSNPNLWHKEFETFRKWLEKEARTLSGRKLTYSTMSHIVKALNNFIKYLGLFSRMQMDSGYANIKCRGFDRNKMNKRGKEDLVQPEEFKQLKRVLDQSRDFFIVLMNSGMRVHELYSLQFSNVFKGSKDLDDTLKKPYEQMGATIYGYIRLESQMKKKYAYRNEKNGTIERKPLKSKEKIAAEFNRIIPITDPETWDILVENRRRAMDEWEARKHKSNKVDDYLLFDVDINEIRRDLRKHTKKTPHCCRHTFTTNTVRSFRGVNYGPELIKGITGHTSVEFERYVHLGLEDENEVKKRKVERF
jgi:integrase